MTKASSETVIAHPAERIDLMEWLTNLSDREYQECSPGHRAAGVFRENGRLGSINVESVGGHLLVQHVPAQEEGQHTHCRKKAQPTPTSVSATRRLSWTGPSFAGLPASPHSC